MLHILRAFSVALLLGAASFASVAVAPEAAAQQNRTPGPTDSVAGTSWRGEFDSQNDYTTSYRFNADGSAEWSDNGRDDWTGRANHHWTQNGSSVTWTHNDGTRWEANLRPGNIMTGVVYGADGEPRGVFRLTKQ